MSFQLSSEKKKDIFSRSEQPARDTWSWNKASTEADYPSFPDPQVSRASFLPYSQQQQQQNGWRRLRLTRMWRMWPHLLLLPIHTRWRRPLLLLYTTEFLDSLFLVSCYLLHPCHVFHSSWRCRIRTIKKKNSRHVPTPLLFLIFLLKILVLVSLGLRCFSFSFFEKNVLLKMCKVCSSKVRILRSLVLIWIKRHETGRGQDDGDIEIERACLHRGLGKWKMAKQKRMILRR